MDYIQKDFVQIFSKSWCPYFKKAKELLNQYNMLNSGKTLCNELDKITNGKDIQNVLTNYTKQKTVPYIFFILNLFVDILSCMICM
jgi:glutaredoxin